MIPDTCHIKTYVTITKFVTFSRPTMPLTRSQTRSNAEAVELQAQEFEAAFKKLRHAHRGETRKLRNRMQSLEQQLADHRGHIQSLEQQLADCRATIDSLETNWGLTSLMEGERYTRLLFSFLPLYSLLKLKLQKSDCASRRA